MEPRAARQLGLVPMQGPLALVRAFLALVLLVDAQAFKQAMVSVAQG